MARPRPRTLLIGAVTFALVVAAAVPAGLYWRTQRAADRLERAATAFATGWRTGTWGSVTFEGATPAQATEQLTAITAGLTAADPDRPKAVEVTGVDGPTDHRGTARLRVTWDLGQSRTWQYDTSVPLVEQGQNWAVGLSPAVVHPQLGPGQVLTVTRTAAARGEIIGARGEVLVTQRPVVTVGLQPGRATDRRASAQAVAALVGVDAADLTKRVLAAAPTAFVEAITLRRTDYDRLRPQLQPIPGAVFIDSTRSLAPTATFARALLGTTGQATPEIIKESKGRVQVGDITGLSGLARAYDARLAGVPGLAVHGVTPDAQGKPTIPAETAQPLFSVAARNGGSVTLSLDQTVQLAAEAALGAATKPAALIAIRASTGEVLAVANGGPNASGYNRALLGQYPPGSTFKVATAYALLNDGLTPETAVPCPASLKIDGRTFANAEGEVLGTVPFHTNFAHSCNTAFVGSSRSITPTQLHEAALALGYGQPNTLGVAAFTGSVPTQAGPVAHAADAIGQGTVLASPLTVASVSASVAAGAFHSPRLVLDDPASVAPPGTGSPTDSGSPSGSAAATTEAGTALSTGQIAGVRSMMREVVTDGTGTALRTVPGGPVSGKTGTAEYGSATPPATHAWFTGFQGDIAFAVVVEGGGFGATTAAPLVGAFLTALQ